MDVEIKKQGSGYLVCYLGKLVTSAETETEAYRIKKILDTRIAMKRGRMGKVV
jgi:hypothetical protein